MWEQYVEKGRQESAALGERALEVRYEDLLTQPAQVIPTIASFCGVEAPAPDSSIRSLQPSRAFAFRRTPPLVAFAGSVRETLARYGYAL